MRRARAVHRAELYLALTRAAAKGLREALLMVRPMLELDGYARVTDAELDAEWAALSVPTYADGSTAAPKG